MFARTAWTRSYALSRTIPGADDALMRRLNPEIAKSWKSRAGRDVTSANHQVLADVLASPGMNIVMELYARMPGKSGDEQAGLTGLDRYNHDDDNWWCAWKPDLHARALRGALDGDFGTDFLPDAKRASFVFRHMDRSELKALSRVESAPALLAGRMIRWVTHPGLFESRKRQLAALANAVATTRWGCDSQGSHASYSHQAFVLLHTMFPNSQAAKDTKYWYACPMLQGGCKKEDPLATLSR